MNETDIRAKVVAVRDDLASCLVEREAAIDAALLGLLTAEHVLMLGPPGSAKSMLVRALCERMEGARYFEHLVSRFSVPEELMGPLSLSALEQDQYRRVTAGMLPEAHIAFLDEVFKANSAILNSLLGIINERVHHEAGTARPVPLLSLFGASNEMPEDANLAAVFDRFLLRVRVPYVADEDSVRRLLALEPSPPAAHLRLDELRAAQVGVRALPLGDEAEDAIVALKTELEQEGVSASDRRWRSCGVLVRAAAWLGGDTSANSEHCEVLAHALWSEMGHIRTVERAVAKICNPLALEAAELEDAAKDLYDQRPSVDDPALTERLEPLLRQIGDIRTRLEQRVLAVPERRGGRARQALKKVETWHRALSQLALRSLSMLHRAPGAA